MKWQNLVKIAVVGTDRCTIPPEVVKGLKDLGIEADDPAALLLQGAATMGMMTKAGYLPETFEGSLPKEVSEEEKSICGKRATQYFGGILKSGNEIMLSEFLTALHKQEKILPTESLPLLFNMAITSKTLWPLLQPVIGKRGEWLMTQNEAWEVLSQQPQSEDWESGTSAARADYLQHLRAEDAKRGLALLTETWPVENVSVRKKLLPVLKTNLSKADEAFLNDCTAEKSKEIRRIAQDLLSRIPGSAYNKRMESRVRKLIQVVDQGEGKTIKIELPAGIDDTMIRDGIRADIQLYRSGQKASQLAQMINRLPLSFWSALIDAPPGPSLELLADSEYGEMLLPAIADAAAHHHNQKWMQAILEFWLVHYEEKRWQHFSPVALIPLINETVFNSIAIMAFPSGNDFPAEHTPADFLLQSAAHRWQEALSRLFFSRLKKYLPSPHASHWGGWHIRKILKIAGYRATAELYPEWRKGWPEHLPVWGGWEREVMGCMETIQLRYRMNKAIREG